MGWVRKRVMFGVCSSGQWFKEQVAMVCWNEL